ncbi:MAG: ribulose-phosphate 3-epimerase [Chitinophagaceae bacterium]|nr:MAG: ribulose-phosphate 3-epimerase [Chitinophagaceae bacterium]
MHHKIAPSILSADFGKLDEAIEMLNQSEADWIHVDIMDGVFVPNISFGFPVLEVLAEKTKKPLDVHLMITEPERYIDRFCEFNLHCLTVHYEASVHLNRTLTSIKEKNVLAGVAINPSTPVHMLDDILELSDLICLMSVNPGFGGQYFIENTLQKISTLKNKIQQKNASTLIEIDGGVTDKNFEKILLAGADVLVAGSQVFKAPSPVSMIKTLKSKAGNTRIA